MLKEVFNKLQKLLPGEVLWQEPMSRHTTWKIGGPADILILPRGPEDIKSVLPVAREEGLALTVIGNGSNLLILDGGIRGLVLKTARAVNNVCWQGVTCIAGAGTMLPVLAHQAAERGLSGLEFGLGLPATVGGATVMNAGIPQQELAKLVTKVHCLQPDGREVMLDAGQLEFDYRSSSLQGSGLIVLNVEFRLSPSSPDQVKQRGADLLKQRKSKQPLALPTAGSVFKNPQAGRPAGYWLDQAGLKGLTRGGAQISTEHANFIVNCGEATAHDVLWLISAAQQRVREQFNVELEPEIRLLGEEKLEVRR